MGIDHWIENGYGDRDRYEEGLSTRKDPDRVVAVMAVRCAGCGEVISEIHFADGRRSYDSHGVRSVLGKGLFHRGCKETP